MEEEQQNQEAPRLVCSPRLTYLSSQQDGSTLYAVVDRVVPFVEAYSLHFTDGQVSGSVQVVFVGLNFLLTVPRFEGQLWLYTVHLKNCLCLIT